MKISKKILKRNHLVSEKIVKLVSKTLFFIVSINLKIRIFYILMHDQKQNVLNQVRNSIQ